MDIVVVNEYELVVSQKVERVKFGEGTRQMKQIYQR